jgi:hypothetical protein
MLSKVEGLATIFKQNLPSILEVVELASTRQYPSVSVDEYSTELLDKILREAVTIRCTLVG